VLEIDPGPGDGVFKGFLATHSLDATKFLLNGTNAATGTELWRSDGTAPGTFLVKDILPGAASSYPLFRAKLGGSLLLFADDGVTGSEPWLSDGTLAGTVPVKDINPGSATSLPPFVFGTGSLGGNDRFYFSASDGLSGLEPWRTDGTASGTIRIRDIGLGPLGWSGVSSTPTFFVLSGGLIYFVARDPQLGVELWAIPVSESIDSDGDGLTDENEDLVVGTSAADADTDDDGLIDGQEVLTHGTDPLDPDSDNDGYDDGTEIDAGTDPLDPASFPQPIPALPSFGAVALVAALAATAARWSLRRRGAHPS
jgi:ELWxxDGT repeat protein